MNVIWSYLAGAVVLAVGLVAIAGRGEWQRARGLDKLIVLAPLFYAAPLAAFGTEHFTVANAVASLVPAWIPWHRFWTFLIGACFLAAALSLVTSIRARLTATLLAATFFSFVVLMDAPGAAQDPRNRFAVALALRQLTFGAGALALAASLTDELHERRARTLATIARYFVAVTVLLYGVEQLLHGKYVPAVPLDRLSPGHALWTYLAGVVYAVAGALLLVGKKTRAAAASIGLTVLVVELAVYVPMAVVERTSLVGLNFAADTLMFGGAVLLLAGALPRET